MSWPTAAVVITGIAGLTVVIRAFFRTIVETGRDG